MTEKMFRKVQPCGMLYTFGREYFLLKPQPVERDSWQGNDAYRWVVVPRIPIYPETVNSVETYYSFARHIVSTAFTVDFSPDMPEINIWQLEDIDVSQIEEFHAPELEPSPDDYVYLDGLASMGALGADSDD